MTDQKNKHAAKGATHLTDNQGARKAFKKEDIPDPDEEPVTESDFDPDSPEKQIQIDDDPEGTKKKIPHI